MQHHKNTQIGGQGWGTGRWAKQGEQLKEGDGDNFAFQWITETENLLMK